jgi:hypothetical protein
LLRKKPGYPLQFLDPLRGSAVFPRTKNRGFLVIYPLRCPETASMPFLGFGFASQTQGNLFTPASMLARLCRQTPSVAIFAFPNPRTRPLRLQNRPTDEHRQDGHIHQNSDVITRDVIARIPPENEERRTGDRGRRRKDHKEKVIVRLAFFDGMPYSYYAT